MNPLRLLSEQNNKYPSLVQDAVSMIEAQYAYLYGIDELADHLEVTKHHLIRVFTASTGTSPGKYLSEIRISHAKSLLLSCEKAPLEIIAGASGYSCANYFVKAFKRQTGMTPTEYAKAFRQSTDHAATDLLFDRLYL